MEATEITTIKSMIPYFLKHKSLWVNYDQETDTLYLHFKKPNRADNSIMEDDHTIVRYENDEVIGVTLLYASKFNT
jgi:uncharacterized protein YuzE